jgi:GT2 family glycosyltransferase
MGHGQSASPAEVGAKVPISTSAVQEARAAPLASVIVVCWNAGEVLGRCLDRLFAQDYANYEIIVVDDGSSDDTLEVAQRAQARGDVAILRSRRNRGCPHARNIGIAHATGEIVAFIDADGFATPSWLRKVVDAFEADPTAGAVASTVFLDTNPLVLNGAGGTVNRQGWAADLCMGQSYERAEIADEALYPMGCGMALRRAALERVGPFDDHMLNYYDDVDYGVRLWRAGFRVVVVPDAWIDHGFDPADGSSSQKQLLCERHRMRVVLKHADARTLTRWALHEARALREAASPRRALKLRAMGWNACHVASALASRWRLRRSTRAPDGLIDPSWGDEFPAGVPSLLIPDPETARSSIEMADPASDGQLLYGWFPVEHTEGRSYRWAGEQAAALIRLDVTSRRLRLDYAQVPADIGSVNLAIRQRGSPDPLAPVWSTPLPWQYTQRSIENHPLALPAGDYEVVFGVREGWSDPPRETRALGFALASISLHDSFEIDPGGLDMETPAVEEQLVKGWFEAEQSSGRSYRWATGNAAAVVRIAERANFARLRYRLPPVASEVKLTVRRVDQQTPSWSTRIAWHDADWHDHSFATDLAAGDYVVSFECEAPWSNPDGRDPAFWAENRSLGLALSSLSFGAAHSLA